MTDNNRKYYGSPLEFNPLSC